MLDLTVDPHSGERSEPAGTVLPAELDFYAAYDWCLNPHLRVGEAMSRLAAEITRLEAVPEGWQTGEVATNIFLLAAGILNCTDEYLRGASLRLPGRLGKTALARAGGRLIEAASIFNWRRLRQARRWREQWVEALNGFLKAFIAIETVDARTLAEDGEPLNRLVQAALPPDLRARYLNVPSPFRRLDMSHHDVLAMGRLLIERLPDRSAPVLLVGLRTSGSYFAPLIRAQLETEGYAVSLLTIEPNKGAGRAERARLERHGKKGGYAVIVDDPPDTGGTVYTALSIARRAGFGDDRLRVLVAAHPSRRKPLAEARDGLVIALDPERWHKRRMLEPAKVKARLNGYFATQGLCVTRVTASGTARPINDRLDKASASGRGSHLKRVFEVRVRAADGTVSTRHVLAKSTGWGWLGYHGFLAGHRLAGHVPPLLGLRDGLVYMDWIDPPAADAPPPSDDRRARIDAAAAYVAARTRSLPLTALAQAGMDLNRQNNGIRLVEKALSRAYGRFVIDTLRRPRLSDALRRQPSPFPTFIDGNMRRSEWVRGEAGLIKTDYEHHGMGKAGLNVTDPAFDLADAMLDLELGPDEAASLIRRYREASGDDTIEARLFLNKLLAGLWNLNQAQEQIFAARGDAAAQLRAHQRFMRAWSFLTVETARHCGGPFASLNPPSWTAPLVALDIDGVIDLRRFGYPSTTVAGMEALSLLKAHEASVALNTARSLPEVKAYCAAYGLSGGIAEHGAFLWDAVAGKGKVLISKETLAQLETLRRHLRQLPGVFLDERHRYSVRAFTYRDKPDGLMSSLVRSTKASPVGDGAVAPLPGLVIERVMAELGLDRLSFHHTVIDTTIVAREADKGSGLIALRDKVLGPEAETIAVGDSKPDLAMFRLATRSYAPSNISCAAQASHLGCRFVDEPFQRGLLAIAKEITGEAGTSLPLAEGDLFFELLRIADRTHARKLLATVFDPKAYRIFLR